MLIILMLNFYFHDLLSEWFASDQAEIPDNLCHTVTAVVSAGGFHGLSHIYYVSSLSLSLVVFIK